jgi:hypothetical protein
MKRLVLRKPDDEFAQDAKRIQQALAKNGFLATDDECRQLWQLFSDNMCAGWMTVPNDDGEILASVSPYFDEGELVEDDDR